MDQPAAGTRSARARRDRSCTSDVGFSVPADKVCIRGGSSCGQCRTKITLWEGDAGYADWSADVDGPTHRLSMQKGGFVFEHSAEEY